MEYRIVYSNELYHHGVKGMKWGVRHDPERVGRTRKPKPLSTGDKKRINQYIKKYGVTRGQAEAAVRRRNKMLKRVAIGTAVTAGAVIGGAALVRYGREYCDDVIKAGTTMQTVHFDTEIINKGKFYTTNKKLDMIKYRGHFGTEGKDWFGRPMGEVKNQILATTSKDIKVIGNKNAEKVYKSMLANNKEFADALKEVPNGSPVDYKAFNKFGLLGNGEALNTQNSAKAQKMFISELKKKGYGAVADFNDRNPIGKGSGFKTRANIVFDNSNISVNNIGKMSMDEVQRDYRRGLQIINMQNNLSDPGYITKTALYTGGTAAGIGSYRQNQYLKRLGEQNKRKRRKRK